MSACKAPGPTCVSQADPIDLGTLAKVRSRPPGPSSGDEDAHSPWWNRHSDDPSFHRSFPRSDGSDPKWRFGRIPIRPRPPLLAYELSDDKRNNLSPIYLSLSLNEKGNQDFAGYSTPFERQWSALIPGNFNPLFPVVIPKTEAWFSELLVVGHTGRVTGDHFFTPPNYALHHGLRRGLDAERQFNAGVPVSLAITDGDGRQRIGISEEEYSVITSVDGTVLSIQNKQSTGYLVSEFGPLLVIGSILAPLAIGLGRSVVSLVAEAREAWVARQELSAARETARELMAGKSKVVLNLAGTGEVPGAINVNNLVDEQKSGIENLVFGRAEDVGAIFPPNSVDEVVSNNVVAAVGEAGINWPVAARGCYTILRSGGRISIAPYMGLIDAQLAAVKAALQAAGFRNITVEFGTVVTAIK